MQESEEEFGAREGSIYKQKSQLSSCSHGLTFRINSGLTLSFLRASGEERHKESSENGHQRVGKGQLGFFSKTASVESSSENCQDKGLKTGNSLQLMGCNSLPTPLPSYGFPESSQT